MADESGGPRRRSWWRLKPSPPQQSLGCLVGLIGAVIGLILGMKRHNADMATIIAANPNATIDFWPFFALWEAILGGLLGMLCGAIIGRFVPPPK